MEACIVCRKPVYPGNIQKLPSGRWLHTADDCSTTYWKIQRAGGSAPDFETAAPPDLAPTKSAAAPKVTLAELRTALAAAEAERDARPRPGSPLRHSVFDLHSADLLVSALAPDRGRQLRTSIWHLDEEK